MLKEIGRIVISLGLLVLAGLIIRWGLEFPEPAQALGAGALGGTIIGALLTYWLKPG